MTRLIELTGNRYGKLVVLGRSGSLKGQATWLTRCECGREEIIPGYILRSGTRTCCGCATPKKTPANYDETGNRYGSLVVIGPDLESLDYKKWWTLCDCGVKKSIHQSSLRSGLTVSCGCSFKVDEKPGNRYGKLTVVGYAGQGKGSRLLWNTLCDCGREVVVIGSELRNGKKTTCGRWCGRVEPKSKLDKAWFRFYGMERKRSQRQRGLEWTLGLEDYIRLKTSNCVYCGLEPKMLFKPKKHSLPLLFNSIDRMDSTNGYVLGNVVSCCKTCNTAKMDLPVEEFLKWAERVRSHNHQSVVDLNAVACWT